MKKILFITLFIVSILHGNYFDVTVKQDAQYQFEEYQLMDLGTGTSHLKKEVPIESVEFHGHFNDTFGARFSKYKKHDDYSLISREVYLGSNRTTYIAYGRNVQKVQYDNKTKIQSTRNTIKYTLYDVLTIEEGNFDQVTKENVPFVVELNTDDLKENNKSMNSPLTYTGEIDKISLSTENLYKQIQNESMNGKDFLNPIGFSKNFNSFIRVYGVFIASYEHHSISKGRIRFDSNGTRYTIGAETNTDTGEVTYKAFNNELKISNDSANSYIGELAKYKGFGFGYKMTLEAYLKDLSLFFTIYEKKTQLKAYHKDNVTKTGSISVAQKSILHYRAKNISFGIKYRF